MIMISGWFVGFFDRFFLGRFKLARKIVFHSLFEITVGHFLS
jgi:hypothetical protein